MPRPSDAEIIAGHRARTTRKLAVLQSTLGPATRVRLVPSNMAAGPCAKAVAYARTDILACEAEILPLSGCDKGVQCGCLYRLESY